MAKPDFEAVWQRIARYAGEEFHTVRGLEFTYQVDSNSLRTSRTDFVLSKGNFERAYEQVPLDAPADFSQDITGTSYTWAVLHDKRISRDDW
jgi:hypothetical protein